MGSNRIIFGVGSLHRLFTSGERQRLLSAVLDVGFRAFDAAPAYGNGVNEVEIGIALRGKRHLCDINTKYGISVPMYGPTARYLFPVARLFDKLAGRSARAYRVRDFSIKEFERSLDQSLHRLSTDYIDNFFIHEPVLPCTQVLMEDIVAFGNVMKAKGKIRALGIAGPLRAICNFPSIASFDVIQTRFMDWINNTQLKQSGKVVLYETYAAYRHLSYPGEFALFVKETLDRHQNARVIVSTKSINTVTTFRDLFCEQAGI